MAITLRGAPEKFNDENKTLLVTRRILTSTLIYEGNQTVEKKCLLTPTLSSFGGGEGVEYLKIKRLGF
jgi:hypothetical protein